VGQSGAEWGRVGQSGAEWGRVGQSGAEQARTDSGHEGVVQLVGQQRDLQLAQPDLDDACREVWVVRIAELHLLACSPLASCQYETCDSVGACGAVAWRGAPLP